MTEDIEKRLKDIEDRLLLMKEQGIPPDLDTEVECWELISIICKLLKEREWKPISKAKDVKLYLVHDPKLPFFIPAIKLKDEDNNGMKWFSNMAYGKLLVINPTHYMDIPKPPKE